MNSKEEMLREQRLFLLYKEIEKFQTDIFLAYTIYITKFSYIHITLGDNTAFY